MLSTYLNQDDVQSQIQDAKDSFGGLIGGSWLVGENWIINADNVDDLQEELGGQIVSFSDSDVTDLSDDDHMFNIGLVTSDEEFMPSDLAPAAELAKGYCSLLESGMDMENVMAIAVLDVGDPFSAEQLGIILGTGVVSYCDEFADEIE